MGKSYDKARIYIIRNTVDDDTYVGSTVARLSKRMSKHREDMRQDKRHSRLYDKMRELGSDNFYIELLEECPVENIEQLRTTEGEYIRQLGTLNMSIAGRTRKEWVDENIEERREYLSNYYKNNPEKFKQYRENNKQKIECLCGSTISRHHGKEHLGTKKHQTYLKQQQEI